MPAGGRGRGTTGWTARRCATTCSGCARARRTVPRVCAFGAVRRATPRGWCCSLWTTRTAIGRSWLGGGLGKRCFVMAGGVAAWGIRLWTCERVCVVCCVFLCVCTCVCFGVCACLKRKKKDQQLRAGPCHGPTTAAYTVVRRDRPKARRPAERIAIVWCRLATVLARALLRQLTEALHDRLAHEAR